MKIPNSIKIFNGVYLAEKSLTKQEQLTIFNYLKPLIEQQAFKTNKSPVASRMIGLGLRWDYVDNNPHLIPVNIDNPIVNQKHKYGYYEYSINGMKLNKIPNFIKWIATKYTGIDTTEYDACIVNIYDDISFISNHNDVEEAMEAINYPVIGLNIGGEGNFYINNKRIELNSGACYMFGVNGKSRKAYHRTFPSEQNGFLPFLKCNLDGKTYTEGRYRITLTLRKALPPIKNKPLIYNEAFR